MRIISKFHDYYDAVARHGADQTIMYVRTATTEEHYNYSAYRDKDQLFLDVIFPHKIHVPSFETVVVGFCGRIYPYLYLPRKGQDTAVLGATSRQAPEYDVFRTPEEIDVYLKTNCKPQTYTAWRDLDKRKRFSPFSYFGSGFIPFTLKHLPEFFAQKVGTRWFDKGPIFTMQIRATHYEPHYRGRRYNYYYLVTCNGRLRDVGFQHVKDPYTAYQELQMYLSNQAVPQKPMPIIPDEDKIQTHGMNEFSFRQPKKTKK